MPPSYRPRKYRQRCMFVMDPTDPGCPEPATETVPGFLPEYHVCKEHRVLVETLIDLAT